VEWSGRGGGLIIMWFSPPPFCRDEGGRLLVAEAVVFVSDSSTDSASDAYLHGLDIRGAVAMHAISRLGFVMHYILVLTVHMGYYTPNNVPVLTSFTPINPSSSTTTI
jgi:hypothetical protein